MIHTLLTSPAFSVHKGLFFLGSGSCVKKKLHVLELLYMKVWALVRHQAQVGLKRIRVIKRWGAVGETETWLQGATVTLQLLNLH